MWWAQGLSLIRWIGSSKRYVGTKGCQILYQKVATFKTQIKEGVVYIQHSKSFEASRRAWWEEIELRFNNELPKQGLLEFCTLMWLLVVFAFVVSFCFCFFFNDFSLFLIYNERPSSPNSFVFLLLKLMKILKVPSTTVYF